MEVRQREGFGLRPELDHLFTTLHGGQAGPAVPVAGSSSVQKTRGHSKVNPDLSKGARKNKHAHLKKAAPSKKVKTTVALAKTCRNTGIKVTALPPKVRKNVTVGKDNTSKPKKTLKHVEKNIKRELATERSFAIRNLKWSPWYLAMAPNAPLTKKDAWAPCRQGHVGMRDTTLFKESTTRPALYEVAVQPKCGCKRYVMHITSSKGFPSSLHWDTYLLRYSHIIAQLENVLAQGCNVFIRRCIVVKRPTRKIDGQSMPTVKEVRRYVGKCYDYAWNKKTVRNVTRKNMGIQYTLSCSDV